LSKVFCDKLLRELWSDFSAQAMVDIQNKIKDFGHDFVQLVSFNVLGSMLIINLSWMDL
jgi:hypothetical protein